jgi:two-component sensor histidine kinase
LTTPPFGPKLTREEASGVAALRSLSVRYHLVFFSALIIGPLLIAGLLASLRWAEEQQENLTRVAIDIARSATEAIDQDLDRQKVMLQVLSSALVLQQGDFRGLYDRAKSLAADRNDAFIGLHDADGNQIFITALPFGSDLLLLDDRILMAAERKAAESRSVEITDLFYLKDAGAHYVAVVYPVLAKGTPHFLNVNISPNRIRSILNSQSKGTGWLMGVVDANDMIVARTWEHDRFVGQKASPLFVQHTSSGIFGTFSATTLDDVPVTNIWFRSPDSNWRVAVAIPTAELQAPVRRSFEALAAISALGILASMLVALLYARFLARPVGALRSLALQVGEGREAEPLRTGVTELDDISRTLADASKSLKKRERSQQVLLNELNHRVKNTLATIQAMARQTLRRSESLDDFIDAFEGRLLAMAKSHDVLTASEWRGGDLRTIVLNSCKPFSEPSRIFADGPDVFVDARAVTALGMIFHELATNAAKYGAFSSARGSVIIRWALSADGVDVTWKERDGPPVNPANKEGFGSMLIVSLVERDLEGQAKLVLEEDGASFVAFIPKAHLTVR